jgi:competence protein CoiA
MNPWEKYITGVWIPSFSKPWLCIFPLRKPNRIIVPLKAIIEGDPVIGPDLSKEEWADLKLRHKKGLLVTMACCGEPGHLRSSKRGTQHFYHAVDAGCNYSEESLEHLVIKEQIYQACKASGWETTVEFPAPDRSWIADVYASNEGRKIVFEIQISPISPDELAERDGKYRNEGIESYWLLDNFLGRSKDFAVEYGSYLAKGVGRPLAKIPYIDNLFFATGPENHIFIAKSIRSVGLRAKKQTLFTTNNPEIPLGVWVREVLRENYCNYLEETAAACERKRRLMITAAPALNRFRDFYEKIVRHKTYRKKIGHYERIYKTDPVLKNDKALQKTFHDLYSEIEWLENEYRLSVSESSGLFSWKKSPEYTTPRLFFRTESEANVKKMQEFADTFSRWETSFTIAFGKLERGFSAGRK